MISAVHHVSFTVSDMERSLEFYHGALGFEVLNVRTVEGRFAETVTTLKGVRMRSIHLSGYGQALERNQYLAAAGESEAPRTCDTGSAHLCYVVDDIDGEIARLKELGVRFLSEVMTVEGGPNAGNRMVYFLDPDGIPMEFTQPARGG